MSRQFIAVVVGTIMSLSASNSALAQITTPRPISSVPQRTATLEERLINRLKATRDEQKAYIKFVVRKVKAGKLDVQLVAAIERKAIRRNRFFPFPFFERAMTYEAAKRRVILPPVRHFVTTKAAPF